jgi:pimeloyl-ACP methyl ester carboxylesterase
MDIHFGDTAKIQAMFDDINIMADQIPVNPDKLVLNSQVLSEISIPVLLVWGDRDFYFPVDIAVELYHSLPNAELWIVPGQGHTPVWSFLGGDSEAERRFKKEVLNLQSK